MKRYWFSIMTAAIAVAGLGTYAVAGATDHLPEYKLATVQGDPAEAEGLSLSGSYGGRKYSESIKVDSERSRYMSREGNWRRYWFMNDWLYERNDIATLVREYRGFMRGIKATNSLYADEDYVVYVDSSEMVSSDLQLAITVLDRATGKERKLEIKTPSELDPGFEYAFLQDVQRTDGELHLLISHTTRYGQNDWRDYAVDLASGEILRTEKLSEKLIGKEWELDHVMTTDLVTDTGDYVLLVTREREDEPAEDGTTVAESTDEAEVVMNKYYSYSYRTGEISALPESFMAAPPAEDGRVELRLTGNELVKASYTEQAVQVSFYDLETGRVKENAVTASARELGADTVGQVRLSADRLYILLDRTRAKVAMLDLATGKLLYEGEAVYEGPKEREAAEMEQLRLLNLQVDGT